MLAETQKDPPRPARREANTLKKEEMMAIVKTIDDISRRFPGWDDDTILKAIRRRPAYQTWPEEVVKGCLLMKTTTVNRINEDRKRGKEASVQTDEPPSRWNGINRVVVREKVIVVQESSLAPSSPEHEN